MALSGILNPALKNIFDRERPTLLRLIDITGFSFPSGHAMINCIFWKWYLSIKSIKSR